MARYDWVTSLVIVDMKLSDIKRYKNNPRHNAETVDKLVESFLRFGFKQPLVVDYDGVIICGDARYQAAKRLGLKTIPCVIADDMTPDEAKAYRILDNKLSEISTWDDDLLAEEIDSCDYDFEPFDLDLDAFKVDPVARRLYDDNEDDRGESYRIVVDCVDEDEQTDLYNRLRSEGYDVRACVI